MASTLRGNSPAATAATGPAPLWNSPADEGAGDGTLLTSPTTIEADPAVDVPPAGEVLPSGILNDLDDPKLVLSPDYIGHDRRSDGWWARLRRATFSQRRSLLRVEVAVLAAVALLVVVSVLLVSPGSSDTAHSRALQPVRTPSTAGHPEGRVAAAAAAPTATTPTTEATAAAPATTAPPATTAVPTAVPPAAAAAAAVAPTTTTPPSTAALTPAQLGAEALALVRYPWQNIPGYSVQFLPISDAPSPGYYGNTTFTWGQAGGVSDLYVYPGETVATLAGITAFEIGHEVDAAYVDAGADPSNSQASAGHSAIEGILHMTPTSWAPDCDCAEQGFLSGWYAAAFSNYWSPGVGNWASIAPEPSGSTLTAMIPWLTVT